MGWNLHVPDAAANVVATGKAVKELVSPLVDGILLDESTRLAAEVLVCSFFEPILAYEDKIAAALEMFPTKVRRIGRRLRAAGVWRGDRLADDVYAMLMDDDATKANVNLALFCGVANATLFAWRVEGDFMFSLRRPPDQTHFDGAACAKCGTAKRYTESGACVECQRAYIKNWMKPAEPVT